ncbi:hypothetical protein E2C01_077731 [Portunus trituberculatus]|uniref:Uncharacterized protein n=1 Tax=Portunus trituberculatus TaxID=210409 RepID=A0A5B7IC70_PORTR|nr:hypothetical protein [Portunus trituberculatus]
MRKKTSPCVQQNKTRKSSPFGRVPRQSGVRPFNTCRAVIG